MMSNFSRSSMRDTSHSSRSESVTRPMLPLNGTAIAWPTWMTSWAGGSSPHGAVMMRTSWPISFRWTCDTIEVLPQRPVSALRLRRAFGDRAAQVGGGAAGVFGPCGADELRVVRVAGAGLGDVEEGRVQPGRPAAAHASRVRRIAQLDPVHAAFRGTPLQAAQRALADREREVGERVGHDREPAHLVDLRDRRRERAEHRELVLDPERQEMPGPRRHLDARDDLDRAVPPRREI